MSYKYKQGRTGAASSGGYQREREHERGRMRQRDEHRPERARPPSPPPPPRHEDRRDGRRMDSPRAFTMDDADTIWADMPKELKARCIGKAMGVPDMDWNTVKAMKEFVRKTKMVESGGDNNVVLVRYVKVLNMLTDKKDWAFNAAHGTIPYRIDGKEVTDKNHMVNFVHVAKSTKEGWKLGILRGVAGAFYSNKGSCAILGMQSDERLLKELLLPRAFTEMDADAFRAISPCTARFIDARRNFGKVGTGGDFLFVLLEHVASMVGTLTKLAKFVREMDMIDGTAQAAISKLVNKSPTLQAVPTFAGMMTMAKAADSSRAKKSYEPKKNEITAGPKVDTNGELAGMKMMMKVFFEKQEARMQQLETAQHAEKGYRTTPRAWGTGITDTDDTLEVDPRGQVHLKHGGQQPGGRYKTPPAKPRPTAAPPIRQPKQLVFDSEEDEDTEGADSPDSAPEDEPNDEEAELLEEAKTDWNFKPLFQPAEKRDTSLARALKHMHAKEKVWFIIEANDNYDSKGRDLIDMIKKDFKEISIKHAGVKKVRRFFNMNYPWDEGYGRVLITVIAGALFNEHFFDVEQLGFDKFASRLAKATIPIRRAHKKRQTEKAKAKAKRRKVNAAIAKKKKEDRAKQHAAAATAGLITIIESWRRHLCKARVPSHNFACAHKNLKIRLELGAVLCTGACAIPTYGTLQREASRSA